MPRLFLLFSLLAAPVAPVAPAAAPVVELTAGPTLRCQRAPFLTPVDAEISEGFNLPEGPYGAGNRGLEYRTVTGQPVRAIGAGTVSFAGTIAGERYVSVAHRDGLVSSYSYLATVEVVAGDRVVAGQRLGTTTTRFQLGLRRDGAYVDPAPLLDVRRRARLVGDDVRPPCGGAGPGAPSPQVRRSDRQLR